MQNATQKIKLLNFYEATFLLRHRFAIAVGGVEGYFRFVDGTRIKKSDEIDREIFKMFGGTLVHFDDNGSVIPYKDPCLLDGFLNLPRDLKQKRYYLANVDVPEPTKALSTDCLFGKYCGFDMQPCKNFCKKLK